MKRPSSDIPENATEVIAQEYREEGAQIFFRVTHCIIDGQVVGQRAYDLSGRLMWETPLKNGQKHGREYIWNEAGHLESEEPYENGQLHGLARQYNRKGNVIGTNRFAHGTGYDVWRYEREDGTIGISEIHSIQDNLRHGFEWWLQENQRSVWRERPWHQGQVHGIERMWSEKGRLKRGYPKYWIRNESVRKRDYLKAGRQDETLPKYREKDDLPQRRFPDEIESLL